MVVSSNYEQLTPARKSQTKPAGQEANSLLLKPHPRRRMEPEKGSKDKEQISLFYSIQYKR
ncbi:hypothetical protein AHMF7605_25910 [Adhaeribacter arboris]|uniref:Uncharacterized protein n=2 Tax=Adhaeribacter arboris TaxID=2072846 RepID=A0A2T2YME4_9BACT|nr:hypothetical protein AHMF7605_25910 [Adhaeribacter arboris]